MTDQPKRRESIFVFGSNLAGIHGAGAALHATTFYDAEWFVGVGPTGKSYAIPTKDYVLKTLSLFAIESFVKDFIEYAKSCPHKDFMLTPIGCGLAGYRRDQIRPLFEKHKPPPNVIYTREWDDKDVNI